MGLQKFRPVFLSIDVLLHEFKRRLALDKWLENYVEFRVRTNEDMATRIEKFVGLGRPDTGARPKVEYVQGARLAQVGLESLEHIVYEPSALTHC